MPDTRPTTPATKAGHIGAHFCDLSPAECLGEQGREIKADRIERLRQAAQRLGYRIVPTEAASPAAVTLSDGTMIPLTDAAAVIEESLAASPAALDTLYRDVMNSIDRVDSERVEEAFARYEGRPVRTPEQIDAHLTKQEQRP